MSKVSLISQDAHEIMITVDDTKIVFRSEGFDVWLHRNHSEEFTKYARGGDNFVSSNIATFALFDIIMFNQSKGAKRYYLQYLSQLVTKGIDKWDKVR